MVSCCTSGHAYNQCECKHALPSPDCKCPHCLSASIGASDEHGSTNNWPGDNEALLMPRQSPRPLKARGIKGYSKVSPNMSWDCAGLGLKLVIVVGHQVQIDERLAQMGHPSTFVGGYRVTDAMALRAAVESSGLTRMQVRLLAAQHDEARDSP